MKLVIADIDCTETVKQAYQEACAVISLPEYEKVGISVYNGRGNVYARGGRNENGYLIKFNGNFYGDAVNGLAENEIMQAVETTTKHEAIHVHQTFTKVPCKHNDYFLKCCQKLGINSENKYSTDKVITEAKTMKNEVGMINIEELKKAAAAMGKTFDEFCQMTGMTNLVEQANEVQTKEREKAEFENLKLDIETFKTQTESEIERIKNQIQNDFESRFSGDSRTKIEFELKVNLKVNLIGAKREGGTRGSQEQSKWKLYIDDVEITGVPDDSEFTTIEENAQNKWNWLGYEVQKIKQPDNISTTLFKNRISLAGVAAYYKPHGVENWDWKEAVRNGKIAERISTEIGKVVRIEEVEKEEEE